MGTNRMMASQDQSVWARDRSRWSRSLERRRRSLRRTRDFTLHQERLESRHLLASDLIITEFLASNRATLDDGNGNSSDWVEIHNASDTAIDLAGYRLTDAPDDLDKWVFPSVTIEPHDYLVVFASGQETDDYVDPMGNLHTNFRLSAGGEVIALVAPDGTVVSQFGSGTAEYPAQTQDTSYGIAQTVSVLDGESDAQYYVPLQDIGLQWTEPGFDATTVGFQDGKAAIGVEGRPESRTNYVGLFTTELPAETHAVYLRVEFDLADASAISSMDLSLLRDNGFVAYLNGHQVISENAPEILSWFATASANQPRDSQAVVPAEYPLTEHLDKLVDGQNVLAIHGLNFVSDSSDLLYVPELMMGTADMQTAFGMPARVGFMTTPTPGRPNVSSDQIADGFNGDVEISVASGFYEEPFQVELSTDTPGATIYYTLDSSRPTATNGTIYSGTPIDIDGTTVLRAATIRDAFIPGRIATNTYVYLDQVLTQDGEGLPETWGVMGNSNNGVRVGDPVPANYEMDPQVVNDRRYRDTIKDDLRAIPVINLVMDPEDLWSEETGLYSNSLREGREWERPISVELLNTDGELEFDVDAGTRMHGGWGRRPSSTNKHSFRLIWRSEYGDTKLRYPMFGEDATQTFDTFVLRANFNHSWATSGDTATTFVNDLFAAETQLEMGWVGPHGNKWVHVYLNGLYWGMYNPMERPSAPFAADYFGGDKDEYDVLVVGSATDGDTRAFNQLTRAARDADYEAVQGMLDIDAFIDYLIINQYGGNWDWPQNNWYASRRRVDGAKWYFHSWDAEGMLGRGLAENRVRETGSGLGGLYRDLRDKVEEFRVRYADRIQMHFFNGGLLTPGANITRLNRLTAPIDRAVVGESARWGDGRWDQANPARTRDDHWLPRLQALREDYFPQRGDRVLEQFRQVGLWPDTEAPQLSRHGGPVQSGFEVTIANPNPAGDLYYTLDGTDPRMIGGDVSPDAIAYSGESIKVDADMNIMARVLNDGEWSPLTQAQFLVTGLRISEVNYHPHDANPIPGMDESAVDNGEFEFIELANIGAENIDLTGARFTQGVRFTFPDSYTLAPAERVVVVSNAEAFQSRYGSDIEVAGEFTGDLSDFGERIELRGADETILANFTYQVSGIWPSRANGGGSSLEMARPQGGYIDANDWQASGEYGGSPGTLGAGPQGDVVINEIVGHGDSPELDMIEVYNSGSQPVELTNWYVGNPDDDPFRVRLTNPTTVGPGSYHVLSEAEFGFELQMETGDNVAIIEADADGRPIRFVDQARFDPAAPGIAIGPSALANGAWLPLAENTLGRANSGLRVGDLIVSEVNFDPKDLDGQGGQRQDRFEFVELYNTTAHTLDVSGWRLSGALDLTLDDGLTVDAGQTLLFVSFSTTTPTANVFRFIYGMDPSAPLAQRYRGKLDNESGVIRVERPFDPARAPSRTTYIYVDEMAFGSQPPFPTGANMTGNTFTRLAPEAFGNAPTSWMIAPASPGTYESAQRVVGDSNEDGQFDQLDIVQVLAGDKYNTGQPASWSEGDWNGDALFSQLDIVHALQSGNYLQTPAAAIALTKSDVDEALEDLFADE